MISLIPPQVKRENAAARTNTLLLRYNFLLLGILAFLLLAIGVVYVYLGNTMASAEKTISENNAKVAGFSAVEEEAGIFRQNLATAKQILDREVNYTKVMIEVAQLLPAGVVLTGLNLDASTFGTPAALSAQAKTYDQALALKDAFSRSSLFSDVHFQSITTTDGGTSGYPLTINLSVTFKKEAAKS